MQRSPLRHLPWLLTAALACDGGTPVSPAPVVLESARFALVDFAATPAAVLEGLAARLEQEFDRVGALLPEFAPPDTPVTVVIQPGGGIPFVTLGENRMTQWARDLAPEYVAHQLTHLYTRYRRSAFIEEGLAVWVTEQLQPTDERPNPYRGQPPHAWVSLYQQHASQISLFAALRATGLSYDYEGSSADASAWQLFIEAASFTRWLIETHGWNTWLAFHASGDVEAALDTGLIEIERAWLAHSAAAYPDPRSCEDALGAVGAREAFWCRRARGQ